MFCCFTHLKSVWLQSVGYKHICKSVRDNRLFHINYNINGTVFIFVVTVRVYWNIQSLMRPHVVLYLVNMWTVQSYLDGTWRSSYTRPVWFNLHSWNKCSRKLNELYCFSSYWHLWLCLTGGQIHAERVLACEASVLNITSSGIKRLLSSFLKTNQYILIQGHESYLICSVDLSRITEK